MITLLLLALIARVGAALSVGGGFHFPDEAIYVDAARRLLAGGGFDLHYRNVPAYPVFLAILSLGLDVDPRLLRVGQAAVAALGSPVLFALGDRLYGRPVAIVAGLVYSLDPLLVVSSGLFYPETPGALLVPIAVLLTYRAVERNRLAASACVGAVLGVLALLRPVALVLVPVVGAWTALMVPARLPRRLAHLAVVGGTFLLVLTPWSIRSIRAHGHLMPIATAGTRSAPVEPEEIARHGLVSSILRWAWTEPGAMITRTSKQFLNFWELTPTRVLSDDPEHREQFHRRDPRVSTRPFVSVELRDRVSAVTFGLELGIALLGLVVAVRACWRRTLLPIGFILAYALGYALFVGKLRYRIPISPLVFLFTGVGACAIYSFAGVALCRRPALRESKASLPQ